MHALAQISVLGLSPVSTPDILAVGHIDYAATLLETFGNPAHDSSRVQVLASMQSLSPKEFDGHCDHAARKAKALDAVDGFVAPSDAKGAYKYGPREKSMRVIMSTCRQVWGVMKQNLASLSGQGFALATKTARAALKDAGKTWDGDNAKTKEQRAEVANDGKYLKAMIQARKDNPGTPLAELGETINEMLFTDKVTELRQSWNKIDPSILFEACVTFLGECDDDARRTAMDSLAATF